MEESSSSEMKDHPDPEENTEKKAKRAKKAMSTASTTSEEIREAEILSEKSLSGHLSAMQPFISSRVYKRLLHYATSDDRTPYVPGPRGKPAQTSKLTPIKTRTAENIPEAIAAVTQPTEIRNVELRDYQLAGVAWLVDRYDKGLHCILADEMGLGESWVW